MQLAGIKRHFMKRLQSLFFIPLFLFFLSLIASCSHENVNSNSGDARLQVALTDAPFPYVKEVWIDVQQIEILEDGHDPLILNGTHPGLYNLFDLTQGKDTLLADATIPPGKISQIRLILGDNNYLVTLDGTKIPLKTPSAQESGLKVQIHQDVAGGILYRLTLDFDAGKSINKAGNSGQYLLKPVLRILSLEPSGGNIEGVVVPGSIRTAVYAIAGPDTVASTFTDTTSGGYLIRDVPANTYSLSFVPSDTTYQVAAKTAVVTLGQVTVVDTVTLQH